MRPEFPIYAQLPVCWVVPSLPLFFILLSHAAKGHHNHCRKRILHRWSGSLAIVGYHFFYIENPEAHRAGLAAM